MKFENTEVWGFKHAIRGMRNPLESWEKSDSFICDDTTTNKECERCPFHLSENFGCSKLHVEDDLFVIGEADMTLMKKLISAGTEHRKFMRQIMVSVDISAPIYWWKEFDTYRIGVTENSTSTMHKLTSKPITIDCFEFGDTEDFIDGFWIKEHFQKYIDDLEEIRQFVNETKDKKVWKKLVQMLPESWLQTRTVTMNYENILNMVHQRQNHKLSEWSVDFMGWVKTLPYSEELIFSALETRGNAK